MKVMLVHLSDIHLKSDVAKNPVMDRSDKIAQAVLSLHDRIDHYVVVVSGDSAYSGAESEYLHALQLFKNILSPIANRAKNNKPVLVVVPGNHDCNFDKEESSRRLLLEKLQPAELIDESPIRLGLQVQADYFTFASSLAKNLPMSKAIALADWQSTARIELDPNQAYSPSLAR